MLDLLKDWTASVAAAAIFVAMVEMLVPKGSMKNYIHLTTGLVILMVILQPILGAFADYRSGKLSVFSQMGVTYNGAPDLAAIDRRAEEISRSQLKAVMDIYRQKLVHDVDQQVAQVEGFRLRKCHVELYEEAGSANYGSIKSMHVLVDTGNGPAAALAMLELRDKLSNYFGLPLLSVFVEKS